MNLPNKLTMLRIILTPIFLAVLYGGFPGADYAALAIFIIASLTDMLDGKIARKYNLVTDFGKFADPLADKILSSQFPAPRPPILWVDIICGWVITLTTLYSGVEYFLKNKDVIRSA